MIKLAVVGGRDFKDIKKLYAILDANAHKIEMIISGGADGADTFAENWAKSRCVPYTIFPAKWRRPDGSIDRGAGHRRNRQIVMTADKVLAFWDGSSTGTKNSIDTARELGKPCTVIHYES